MSRPQPRPGAFVRLAGAAIVAAVLSASPACADVVSVAAMMRGVSITAEQCSALPQAVWISTHGKSFCVRYYLSTAGGDGRRPVVMLQGDQLGRFDSRSRRFEPAPDAKLADTNTDDLMKFADRISQITKAPAIYLARIGLDGSGGHHGIRHSFLELYATYAALETIKLRHRFEGYNLIGQSGGATLVGGLLALRNDIACAVPGSGRLALLNMPRNPDPLAAAFDPSRMAPTIARNRNARILVVTDPQDEVVPAQHQSGFVSALRQAGGTAEQFFVEATDPKRHGVSIYATYAAAACLRGNSTEEVGQELAALVEKRVAAARAKAERESRPQSALPEGVVAPRGAFIPAATS